MDSLQAQAYATQARQDVPQMDPRTGKIHPTVAVAVELNVNGLVACSQYIPRDVNEDGTPTGEPTLILVQENRVPELLALVEDAPPERMQLAQEDLEDHEANREDHDQHRRHWKPSFEASFRQVMKRDMRPLKSVKVLRRIGEDEEVAPKSSGRSKSRG